MAGGHPKRPRRAIIAAVALVVAAVGAGVVLVSARHTSADAAEQHEIAEAIEILQVRAELRRVHLAEVDALMLELLGAGDHAAVLQARDERIAARDAAVVELERLAAGRDTNAIEAGGMLVLLAADEVDDSELPDGAVSADVLFYAGRAMAHDGRPLEGLLPLEVDALYSLMRLDSIGSQILNDGLDAEYTINQPEMPETLAGELADYVIGSEPYILADGGYLGPDRAHPLVDSYVWFPNAGEPHPAVAVVEGIVVDSPLWEYDQWVISWQTIEPGEPPLTLAELAEAAAGVDTEIRTLIDTTLADAHDESAAASAAASRSANWRVAAAAVLFAVVAPLAAWEIVLLVRRTRSRRRLASTDRLTGAGNRHRLEERTASLLADPSFDWHLVAVIDMDRFKLINDTWGHAVGDAVLVEVVTRLHAVLASLRAATPGVEGTVVRLGGDEFLLSVHSREPLDRAAITQQLEDIRASSIVARDGERLPLGFSVGIATAQGPSALAAVMDEADLATYEDKARRIAMLGDRREVALTSIDVEPASSN